MKIAIFILFTQTQGHENMQIWELSFLGFFTDVMKVWKKKKSLFSDLFHRFGIMKVYKHKICYFQSFFTDPGPWKYANMRIVIFKLFHRPRFMNMWKKGIAVFRLFFTDLGSWNKKNIWELLFSNTFLQIGVHSKTT